MLAQYPHHEELTMWLVPLAVIVVIVGFVASRQARDAASRSAAVGGGLALGVILLLASAVTVIPAGHVGIVDLFGRVSDVGLQPGVRLVIPLARVHKMSVRTREVTEAADVPSSEGLVMHVDVTLLYNLDPTQAPEVYRSLGSNYEDIYISPQLRSHLRDATASFEAKALYTTAREGVASRMMEDLGPALLRRGFTNTQVLLRAISLPNQLRASIEQKLQAEQQSEQMRFVLDRERQEAERKRIEAQGIADFQRIVAQGIDERLLRWKGIEATQALAASQNAKLVIVGGRMGCR
jgi:regulator of protease activity HflC (stomatin/prohibitin superfamily)